MYTSINEGAESSSPPPKNPSPPQKMENKEADPYQEYDTLFKQYNEAVKDKDDAARELQRLKDAQKLR